ncbi:MAG: hypothetical protein ISS78_10370, partial [Phycisphaerae bacterium]|nr:hypothetical protein [Phycisphaerae bacterium]
LAQAMDDPGALAEHLAECDQCRLSVEQMTAHRERLRAAMADVRAPAGLAGRIRADLAAAEVAPAPGRKPGRIRHHLRARLWPFVAAAAALVLMGLPLGVYFWGPSPVSAAQRQLRDIHKSNLTDGKHFYSQDEPAKLAQYFRDELGFTPVMPKLHQGMEMRGCCVAHFRDRPVGSYVVQTPVGIISVIVVPDKPESLDMKSSVLRNGSTYYIGGFAKSNMAAVRLNDLTYCAVGEVQDNLLLHLLDRLVPQK